MAEEEKIKEIKCWKCHKLGHLKYQCPEISCYYCGGHHMKNHCWKYQINYLFKQKQNYNKLQIKQEITITYQDMKKEKPKKSKNLKPKKKTPKEKRISWLISMKMKKQKKQQTKETPWNKQKIKEEQDKINKEKQQEKEDVKRLENFNKPSSNQSEIFSSKNLKTYYDRALELKSEDGIQHYLQKDSKYIFRKYVCPLRIACENYIKPWKDNNGEYHPNEKEKSYFLNKRYINALYAYEKINIDYIQEYVKETYRLMRKMPYNIEC